MDITFPIRQWNDLHEHLLGPDALAHGDESLAFLLAAPVVSARGSSLIVRDILRPEKEDYEHRSGAAIRPTGDFVARALSIAKANRLSIIEVHTHPFDRSDHTTFSGIDWGNDRTKMPQLIGFMPPGFVPVTMVMGRASFDAHYYDTNSGEILPVGNVRVVGGRSVIRNLRPTSSGMMTARAKQSADRLDRQRRFLGDGGVDRIQRSSVAIVGVGGIGSFVALELAHLGVGEISLIDPDVIEETNLNRLIGAGRADVGRNKVEVIGEYIRRTVGSDVRLNTHTVCVDAREAVEAIKSADVIFGCLDNHGARLILNQLSLQYVAPLLDAGSGMASGGSEKRFGGQVQLVAPGRGCLVCRGFVDAKKAAFDLASPERQAEEIMHGYGTTEPAPAVISLNGVVASLQVSEFLRMVGIDGICDDVVIFEGYETKVYPVVAPGATDCAACGPAGIVGYGDLLDISAESAGNDAIPAVRPQ